MTLTGFPDPVGSGSGTHQLEGYLFAAGDGKRVYRLAVSAVDDPTKEYRATARNYETGMLAHCNTAGGERAEIAVVDLGEFTATCDGTTCTAVAPDAKVVLGPGVFNATDMRHPDCAPSLPLVLDDGWY